MEKDRSPSSLASVSIAMATLSSTSMRSSTGIVVYMVCVHVFLIIKQDKKILIFLLVWAVHNPPCARRGTLMTYGHMTDCHMTCMVK